MTLSPPVRTAVLEVVRRLRDPMRECHVDSVGFMVLEEVCASRAGMTPIAANAVLDSLRWALDLPSIPGSLARWARGKSREEVARALQKVATPEAEER